MYFFLCMASAALFQIVLRKCASTQHAWLMDCFSCIPPRCCILHSAVLCFAPKMCTYDFMKTKKMRRYCQLVNLLCTRLPNCFILKTLNGWRQSVLVFSEKKTKPPFFSYDVWIITKPENIFVSFHNKIASINFDGTFHNNSLFFPWNPYLKTDCTGLLILFSIKYQNCALFRKIIIDDSIFFMDLKCKENTQITNAEETEKH